MLEGTANQMKNPPRAKYFISPGNLQGKDPFKPIPLFSVAATIAVIGLRVAPVLAMSVIVWVGKKSRCA
jgi:hypothetical protein